MIQQFTYTYSVGKRLAYYIIIEHWSTLYL
jgi:hypothetical protein